MTIDAMMRLSPVIPVVTIGNRKDARPIAEALRDGGINVIEVTLRTPAAIDAIRDMSTVGGITVGAGTLLTPKQMDDAAEAGASFSGPFNAEFVGRQHCDVIDRTAIGVAPEQRSLRPAQYLDALHFHDASLTKAHIWLPNAVDIKSNLWNAANGDCVV